MSMTSDPVRAKELRDQGIRAYQSGDKAGARALLEQSASLNMHDEHTFLWLSAVLESDEEKREALEYVLSLNPHNEAARKGLAKLDARRPAPASKAAPTAPAITTGESPVATPAAPASYFSPTSETDRLSTGTEPLPVMPEPTAARREQRQGGGSLMMLLFVLGIVGLLIALAALGIFPPQ